MIIPPLMMYQATPQRADTNKNKLHNAEEISVYISILCVMYLFINVLKFDQHRSDNILLSICQFVRLLLRSKLSAISSMCSKQHKKTNNNSADCESGEDNPTDKPSTTGEY